MQQQSDSVECGGNMSASIALNKSSSSSGPGVGQSQKVKQEYFAKLNGHQSKVISDSFDSDSPSIIKAPTGVRIMCAEIACQNSYTRG